MLAGDVGKQGKCSLPCFLFLMYASAETLTNSRKKARISDSGSTHYLLNSRTISLVVLGYSRSNNCVYLLLPWLYLEFVQPSLDGPTSPLNGGARIPGPHLLFMSDSYRWSLSALSYSTSVHISHKVRSSELGLKTYLSDLHYCSPGCGCTLSLHVRNLSKQKYFVKILAAHFPAHRKYD